MSETPTTDNDDLDEDNVENANENPNWEEEATKWKEQAEKWKALSRKNEKTLKEVQATPTKVSGSNEDVIKQLQDALESSKAEIAQFQKQTLVSEALKLYNLPEEAASLLRGETEEELETSAEALKKLLGGKAKAPVINTQGLNSGEPTEEQLSEEEELALYLKNRKKQ